VGDPWGPVGTGGRNKVTLYNACVCAREGVLMRLLSVTRGSMHVV
jgi:hypothetical protein